MKLVQVYTLLFRFVGIALGLMALQYFFGSALSMLLYDPRSGPWWYTAGLVLLPFAGYVIGTTVCLAYAPTWARKLAKGEETMVVSIPAETVWSWVLSGLGIYTAFVLGIPALIGNVASLLEMRRLSLPGSWSPLLVDALRVLVGIGLIRHRQTAKWWKSWQSFLRRARRDELP